MHGKPAEQPRPQLLSAASKLFLPPLHICSTGAAAALDLSLFNHLPGLLLVILQSLQVVDLDAVQLVELQAAILAASQTSSDAKAVATSSPKAPAKLKNRNMARRAMAGKCVKSGKDSRSYFESTVRLARMQLHTEANEIPTMLLRG